MTNNSAEARFCSKLVLIRVNNEDTVQRGDYVAHGLSMLPRFKELWMAIKCKHCLGEPEFTVSAEYRCMPIHPINVPGLTITNFSKCLCYLSNSKRIQGKDFLDVCHAMHLLQGEMDLIELLFYDWIDSLQKKPLVESDAPELRILLDIMSHESHRKSVLKWMWPKLEEILRGNVPLLSAIYKDVLTSHPFLHFLLNSRGLSYPPSISIPPTSRPLATMKDSAPSNPPSTPSSPGQTPPRRNCKRLRSKVVPIDILS